MPRFAANLSTLFTDHPFLDRFAAASSAGFTGCELLFPYLHEPERVADRAAMANLPVILFSAPPGDWAAGERGLAALPGRRDEFREGLEVAMKYAEYLNCRQIHVMAGLVPEERWDESLDLYLENITYAAHEFARENITCLIEPLSPQTWPDYFLSRPDDAVQVIAEIGAKNIGILYDVFHAQQTQGGISTFIESHLEIIRHIQVAGIPGHNEPDQLSELNYRYLFDLLDASGYDGWIGCEYTPRGKTETGLYWARDWLKTKG